MRKQIVIDLEVSDDETMEDIVEVLQLTLPYMADNVLVRSGNVGDQHLQR